MRYKLYTTVDITNTGQHKNEPGKETARWKEQNFQTVLQTLGIRANVSYYDKPIMFSTTGSLIGFDTKELISVWQFNFETERDQLFEHEGNPVGFLLDDFEMVPYISGLDESMTQNYDVFVTYGPTRNIVFAQN